MNGNGGLRPRPLPADLKRVKTNQRWALPTGLHDEAQQIAEMASLSALLEISPRPEACKRGLRR